MSEGRREDKTMVRGRPLTVVSSEAVRKAVWEHGGDLYLWTERHGWWLGGITLLEADTQRPVWGPTEYERAACGDFDVFIALGPRDAPDEVVLELEGRRHKKIVAYWNNIAYVI